MKPVATTATEQTTTSLTPTDPIAALLDTSDPVAAEAAITEIANNIDNLTAEQLDQIAASISKAPTSIKKSFENQVNIFGGGLDNYVPADSNVTVAQRRALVAIGAALTALPLVTSRKR